MKAFAILATLALTPAVWAQTAPYTVGTTAGDDWTTITAAANWLAGQGSWSDEVLIQIRPGTYPGIVTLTVPAAGGGPVRFARLGGGTVNVGHPSSTTQPGGFRIYGWDGVTFEDLNVNAYGTHALEFGGGASGCVVRRCTLKLDTKSTSVGYSDELDNWTWYQGVAAIRGHWSDGVEIDRCTVTVASSNSNVNNKGIWVSTNCTVTNCTITGNGVGADDGIFLSKGSLEATALVANCVVSKFDYRSVHCDSGDTNVYHCTLYGTSTSPTSILFSHGSSGMSQVRNCIFYNDSAVTGHYCLWASYGGDFQTLGTLDCDYNLFYAPKGAYCGYARTAADETGDGTSDDAKDFNAGKRVDLEAWQAATGLDLNSRFGNPFFVSAGSNFRLKDLSPAQGRGEPGLGVSADLAGLARNPASPDVGAYENPSAGPGAPLSGPIEVVGGGTNLQAKITELTQRGVDGPVILTVSAETYSAVAWDAIPGVSSVNAVLLQTFWPRATIANPNGTALRLLCANHLTVDAFAISATNGYAIDLPRGSRNVTIHANLLSATRTSGSSRAVLFNDASSALTNCWVDQNQITMTVNNSGSEHYAIRNLADMMVTDNELLLTGGGGGSNKAVFSTNYLSFIANRVVGDSTKAVDGLYLTGVWPVASWPNAPVAGAAIVNNNIIRGFVAHQVWVYGGAGTFLHNTLVHTNASVAGKVVEVKGGSNTTWTNNILSLAGTSSNAFCFYRQNSATVVSDYNCLYRTGSARTGYWGSAKTTLADWKNASSQDAHSISADPNFSADYHLVAPSPCRNVGNPAVSAGDDVDGTTRTDGLPDLGADEISE